MNEGMTQLEQRLAKLELEFEVTLGRANALNMVAIVMAREWGKPAAALVAHLETAIENVTGAAVMTPLKEETIRETRRCAEQVLDVLRHADRNGA